MKEVHLINGIKLTVFRYCNRRQLFHLSWAKACTNRPFPSSPQSLFQSKSKCEYFVMVISSIFKMNENWFSLYIALLWNGGWGELGNGLLNNFNPWSAQQIREKSIFNPVKQKKSQDVTKKKHRGLVKVVISTKIWLANEKKLGCSGEQYCSTCSLGSRRGRIFFWILVT